MHLLSSFPKILLPLAILLVSIPIFNVRGSSQLRKRDAADATDGQPKIITRGGNLIFQTGTNHNITFRSGASGSVVVDGEDLRQLITLAKDNRQKIDQLQTGGRQSVGTRLRALEDSTTDFNNRITDLTNRVVVIETALNSNRGQLSDRVTTLEATVRQLSALLTVNECQSNACRNGGTCTDLYNGFSCQCTTGWTGPTCETDINECSVYAGTDLGCQNGATCQNSPGSFSCICPPNMYGIRCTATHDDCSSASNQALCGHGTCLNLQRESPGLAKYRCICDVGWTTNGVRPECTVDVNECNDARPPCSANPAVMCINIPGSFTCGPCPAGFSGNGFVCNDVDECQINNGGCSLAPRVRCINSFGSRSCDACPPGYQGDGITCSYIGICGQNNGGCHHLATCHESPGIQGRSCTCPMGYMGSGIGPSGCSPSAGPCAANPCVHGTCRQNGASYSCTCIPGWSGFNCDQQLDGCVSNPCRNGGTCAGRPDGSFVCACTDTYTGPTCQQAQQTCGGLLTGESGSFRYPRTSSETYPHGVSCAWVITTSPDKILILTFPLFKLEYSPNCNFDFLQVHDGPSASSHMIGKYCGNRAPNGGMINTTSNQVYLWFRSDASQSSDGFRVIWSSAQPTCGGNIVGSTHGVISSPGYPGNYPHNRDCVWTVSGSPGQKIGLSFGQLALERHPNCSYDYLEVRDGLQESDTLLQRFCSFVQPPPLETTGPYAFIRFHSDDSASDRGFQISFATTQGCGSAYTEDSGVLISPNYPNPYPHDAQCIYTISVPQGERITFEITNIDLEVHGNCMWDFVEVREGLNERGTFLGRFCGSSAPPVYRTTGNNLWIKFKSDSSNRGSGFRATWNVACGGNFTNATGELRSPYFPNPYPNDKECFYTIRQPEGSTITLTFASFDIEASFGSNCNYDFLEVRNGLTPDGQLIGRYCGSSVPGPIQSRGGALWLKFKSDGSRQNHGFRATYATTNTGCGGVYTSPVGVIQSPRHPNFYPHGVNCTWFITVTPGFIIRLSFNSFSLESHSTCAYDYVEIFDNYTASNSLGRFCGNNHPPVVTSSDNAITIRFVTDISVAREGFTASYVSLNATTICGGEYRSEAGVVTSPNFPRNYPHNRRCTWTITVPSGRQILLNITDFAMESHSNCNYDYLEIRNGGFETSPLIGKYCGNTIDQVIRSQSNRLYLKMETDYSVAHRGFRLYYDGTTSGCGGDLLAVTGSFVSPNYPMAFPRNAECFWLITVAQGSTVNLHFPDFIVDSYRGCAYNYVEVRESGPLGQLLGRLCGSTIPDFIQSRTNKMWIKFRSQYSGSGRGFHSVYYANCNNRLRSQTGIIESPNFPRPYPANRDCTWVIEATLGNTVNASFSHFEVQPGGSTTSCTNDYLELRDGPDVQGRLIGHYCGTSSLPGDVSTTSRFLYIHFVSDSTVSHNGFRLEYIIDGCGGQLTGSTGAFTSLNYPQPYPHQRECIWTISTAPGSRIEFTIHDFDVEAHANCSFDVLEVYGGLDLTSPRLTQLCHTQNTSQVLTSTGNNMVVRFVSDISQSGRGFNATYRSITGGCGGNFSTRTGTLMSQNFPNAYPHYTDCLWTITVGRGRPIVLTFEQFDVEGPSSGQGSSCQYDYVAVYESMEFNSSQLLKACGNALPSPSVIRSSSNQLYIRMRSDGSVTGRGFKATYKTGCGGTLSAETDGQLTSPGWPNHYEILNNCTWLIQGDHTGDRVTLTFLHLDLENNNNNCSDDYVRVLEGNDLDAPEIGRYCGTTAPLPITSVGSAMVVQFVTDASHQRMGFLAVYTKSTSACGGDFTAEHGAFNSPRYPDSYPNNIECVWTITSSDGNSIMLSFGFFNIEPSQYCNNDYVEVRQGNSGGQVIGRYCGSQIPTNQTMGNRLWIKFKSNENVPGQGFMATYNSIYGGQLSGNTGQLASPLYPNNYPLSVDYTWVITVDLGLRIYTTFQEMNIEISPTCYYDYVRLRDGNSADSPELGKFCGVTIPQPVRTSSNQLRVEFHSDSSSTGRGFLMNWQSDSGTALMPDVSTLAAPVAPGCSFTLNATENFQTFTSPQFPQPYAGGLQCDWAISTSSGNSLLFQFTNLSLPRQMPSCYGADRLYLRSAYYRYIGIRPTFAVFCGTVLPADPVYVNYNMALVRFMSNPGVNAARNFLGFSLDYKSVCGGIIQTRQGSLSSPRYPNNYPDNANCTWRIVVLTDRTIQSVFSGTFGINGQSGQCGTDYIEVFNGIDTTSPSLGRFCGNSAPSIPVSSSNIITVVFISDSDGMSSTGFNLSFSEVQLACGGPVTLTETVSEGFIASPNYPQNYIQNVDCVWIITVPANRRARVEFTGQFDIESHSRCDFDFVELRNGGTSNSPLLGKFCGTTLPSTQEATGNVLYARFRTDISIARIGFRARISYDLCGGTISTSNGSLISPNYPANYPVNVDCEWFIQGATGHYLKFSFEQFNLEWSQNCTADFIEVREFNSTGNILLRSCGSSRPAEFDTSDSYAYVKFHSNNQQTFSGFKLNFVSSVEACGGQLTTPYGTITSPGYPRFYAHSRVCEWTIHVPEGRKISLVFSDMDISNYRYWRGCGNSYVQVTNGIIPLSPIIGRFCGQTVPTVPIESSSNSMKVTFVSDTGRNGRGFSATYSSNNPSECGGIFNDTETSGLIESPGFSDNVTYNASEQCIWVIANRNQHSSIEVRFLALDLEAQGECSYDFVEIREGTDENGELVGRFCRMGRGIQPAVLSPLPSLWIRFISDSTNHRPGFQLSYTFTECGGLLTSSNGIIASPNYPSYYALNTSCTWKISAPEGNQIKIRFETFNPAAGNCSAAAAYLEIFNGGLPSSPSARKYCSGSPSVFKSQSNEVRVVFYTSASGLSGQRFRLAYNFESGGCGGTINSQEGVLTSPNWPSNYNASVECIWDVTVGIGYHIIWQFTPPFDLEISNPCRGDFVEISEPRSVGPFSLIGRYCGNQVPPSGASQGNQIRIKFRSNARNQGNGFAFNFTTGCGARFTERQGVIMSPGYPNNYANNLNCTYEIDGDPQKYLSLTFDPDHFFVDRGSQGSGRPNFRPYHRWGPWGCYYDSVQVFSLINSTRRRLGSFCGSTAPQTLGSFGGLVIVFTTDGSQTDRGWIASYEQSECGGRLTDPEGVITSPSHPQRYITNANCTWTITVASNKIVKLWFQNFSVEPHSLCSYDYVAIYDGSSADPSRLIGRYCGSEIPSPVASTGNSMLFNFISDDTTQREGFYAIYSSAYGPSVGCGGIINSTSGSIQSIDINRDGLYETDLECVWQLTLPQNFTIFLQFNSFELVSAGCYDYLEVRDGFFETDPLFGKFCGGSTPGNFTSTTNMLYIKFVTDSSQGASGFSLQFTGVPRLCGSTSYSSNVSQIITSPNYPLPYASNLNCRWTIDGPVDGQIEVAVTVFDIENSTNCDNGYLEIGDATSDPILARGGISPQSYRVCGNTIPRPFFSIGRTVTIAFVTGEVGSGQWTGFQLSYKTATCNRTYTAPSGWLTSPRYPSNYPINVNCRMNIQTSPGFKLQIFFADMQIERQDRCPYDYLKVYNGSQTTSQAIATLCGFVIPSPIFLNNNEAVLSFITDGSDTHRGFALTYTASATGCGGVLTNPSGVFTSPNFPRNIDYAIVCQWSIEIASSARVNFRITIQQSRNGTSANDCTNSRVNVYDGPNTSSRAVMYCTAEGQTSYVGSSNRLLVVFTSSNSASASNIAFNARYNSQ